MPNRTDVLNHLAMEHNLKTYLEIGVQDRKQNFDKIICRTKVGVDPDPNAGAEWCTTSDDFFLQWQEFRDRRLTKYNSFDLVFIDGLHSAQQVQKDFNNAMKIVSEHGFVVLHDTNPASEELTHWPRDKKGSWNGSVFGFAAKLKFFHYDPVTVDVDHGVTIVRGDDRELHPIETNEMVPWEIFDSERKEFLNLISWDEFIRL